MATHITYQAIKIQYSICQTSCWAESTLNISTVLPSSLEALTSIILFMKFYDKTRAVQAKCCKIKKGLNKLRINFCVRGRGGSKKSFKLFSKKSLLMLNAEPPSLWSACRKKCPFLGLPSATLRKSHVGVFQPHIGEAGVFCRALSVSWQTEEGVMEYLLLGDSSTPSLFSYAWWGNCIFLFWGI